MRCVKAIALVLLFTSWQNACRTKQTTTTSPKRSDTSGPLATEQFAVGPAQSAKLDNPPCVRRGMDDVVVIAKNFAAKQGNQSFSYVGKNTPQAPVILKDPSVNGGRSLSIEGVDDRRRGSGPEVEAILTRESYSSCGTVAFLLPANSSQIRVVLTAGDEKNGQLPCNAVQPQFTKCDVDGAAWVSFHEDRYFVATFKNWSPTLTRTAKIELYPMN
ncbi:MAG: hypothetical protein JWO71_2175 [Candidatus Acidoferrum typicum]|nr:hypothetical protein [Candidatus Acidoferrum typicum]